MDSKPVPKKAWFTRFWTKFRSRFKAKRPFSLTKPGWVFILYTIGVGAGAINTGNNLLYLIFGLFLGLIMASGVLSDLSLWGIEVTCVLPSEGQAQLPYYIGLRVINHKKWIPSLSVRVAIEGRIHSTVFEKQLYIPSLKPRTTTHHQLVFSPAHRGHLRIDRIKLLTRFPFGLLLKWWIPFERDEQNLIDNHELQAVIRPAVLPVGCQLRHQMRQLGEQQQLLNQTGEGVLLKGVRPYSPPDHPKRIHWKASAKRSAASPHDSSFWVTKELEQEGEEATCLLWPSQSRIRTFTQEEFELLVSLTYSLLMVLRQQQKTAKLMYESMTPQEFSAITRPEELVRFLSLVEKEGEWGGRKNIREKGIDVYALLKSGFYDK